MKARIYTPEEIKILKQNMFVRDILRKQEIVYDPLFKLWVVMMKLEMPEVTAREIFSRAGFNINILHPRLPQRRVHDWFDSYKRFGIKYFIPEDEKYSTINGIKVNHKQIEDSFRSQLSDIVLGKLKEHENDNR